MIKIFFDNKVIVLTDKIEESPNVKYLFFKDLKIKKFLKSVKNDIFKEYRLIGENVNYMFSVFCGKVPVIKAGGGIVINDDNKVLFIFRNGKWDLPKGKVEIGEAIECAAKREVEEETGISTPDVIGLYRITYHVFERKEKFYLKESYWYNMYSNFSGNFAPQLEEGIDKVEWLSCSEIEGALSNSYKNIKLLFEAEDLKLITTNYKKKIV